ncbi:YhbY family RNA-binding protein [Halieaceae bacterium]|nr:YhbY family RNA-binding protein [Halieaceae bacterium]
MSKSSFDNKQLRAIGHKLKPVVTVAGNGVSESVLEEINRALNDHELIKVKINVEREYRQLLSDSICQSTSAELIQSVGGIVLILRRTEKPNPRLSNLIRRV